MNTKSFRSTMKEIATGLFAHDQVQLRASIVRAGCAMSSVYAETQAEYLRNASVAVKYIVTQNQFHDSAPVRIMPMEALDSPIYKEIGDKVVSTIAGQPALYNGLAIATEVAGATAATSSQKLLRLYNARWNRADEYLELIASTYVLAEKEEFIVMPAMPPAWFIDALTA